MKKKVALFLPTWATYSLIRYLVDAFTSDIRPNEELVLAVPEGGITPEEISAVYGKHAVVREYYWLDADRKSMRAVYKMNDDCLGIDGRIATYVRPADSFGGYDFLDCDIWRFWGIPNERTIIPLKPLEIYYLGEDDLAGQLDFKWIDNANPTRPQIKLADRDVIDPLTARRARAFSYRLASIVYVPNEAAANVVSSSYLFDIAKCREAKIFPRERNLVEKVQPARGLIFVTDKIKKIDIDSWERAYRLWFEDSNAGDIYVAIHREKSKKNSKTKFFSFFRKEEKSDYNHKNIFESVKEQYGRAFVDALVLYEHNEFDFHFFENGGHNIYIPSWDYRYISILFVASTCGAKIYLIDNAATRYLAQLLNINPVWICSNGRMDTGSFTLGMSRHG